MTVSFLSIVKSKEGISMGKSIFRALILCAACFSGTASDVDLTLPENWVLANVAKNCKAEFVKNKDGSLTLNTNSPVCYLTRSLNFEKGRSYRIEGRIESNCLYYVKLYFMNDKGKLINQEDFHLVPDSTTELIAAADAGSTVVKVRDASRWQNGNSISVAMGNPPEPSVYSARKGIREIRKNGDIWEIELKKPFGIRAPQGAKIAQTFCSDGKILANQYRLPTKPVDLSFTLHADYSNKAEANKWWPDAKSASLQVILHGDVSEKSVTFSGFKITEINTDW